MKIKDRYTEEESYIQDKSSYPYTIAASKIDESNLKKISSDMGIDYIHMQKQSDIDNKLNEIISNVERAMGDSLKSSYTDIYYIFVIPLCLLLIYEFINYRRRL